MVGEIVNRYESDLYGFYFDGGIQKVDGPLLRKTVLDKMPNAVLIQNQGLKPEVVDYGAHERMEEPYPAVTWLRCQTITEEWWAKKAPVRFAPELAYRYTILQAAVKDRKGEKIKLVQNESGITLTVTSPSVWDDIDTIIELK